MVGTIGKAAPANFNEKKYVAANCEHFPHFWLDLHNLCVQFSLCALYFSSQKQTDLSFFFYIETSKIHTKNEKNARAFLRDYLT